VAIAMSVVMFDIGVMHVTVGVVVLGNVNINVC